MFHNCTKYMYVYYPISETNQAEGKRLKDEIASTPPFYIPGTNIHVNFKGVGTMVCTRTV